MDFFVIFLIYDFCVNEFLNEYYFFVLLDFLFFIICIVFKLFMWIREVIFISFIFCYNRVDFKFILFLKLGLLIIYLISICLYLILGMFFYIILYFYIDDF